MPLLEKLGLYMSNIISLSNSENSDKFLKEFCALKNPESTGHLLNVFSETPKELFLYKKNNQVLGRLCVNETAHNESMVLFGFVQYDLASKDAIKELIAAGEAWAKERGKLTLIGPADLNVWMGNRFKKRGSEMEFSWEPNNPTDYVDDFLNNGFELDQGYITNFYATTKISYERTRPAYEASVAAGCTFRNLDPSVPGEIDKLYQMNLSGFCINYLYEPISQEQYTNTHILGLDKSNLPYSFWILNKDGEEMGYVYSLIDGDYHIIKSIVMNPKFQGAKNASALVHRAFKKTEEDGVARKAAGALVRKGNVSEHFFNHLGDPTHTHEYTMVKKGI